MFFSLLAASADGFVRGFIAGSIGVKFRFYDFIKAFVIIFVCCLGAAVAGSFLGQTQLGQYINLLGVAVMLALAWTAVTGDFHTATHRTPVWALALSVAMDAAVVCIYLAMSGYNLWQVSFLAAILHSVLMVLAAEISGRIIRKEWIVCTRYISGMIFLAMAVYKIIGSQ